jgi:hypothetical protein
MIEALIAGTLIYIAWQVARQREIEEERADEETTLEITIRTEDGPDRDGWWRWN